ncbi:hypothetical protein PFISCL1PPCAC_15366 [Pristionchus fissidentatus]|uniref:DM domain-containing protein n=1 Tax=Pristionchus fissidentatus TaxID=1538716 RepID=A0AAV5W2C5_9BILA|nr:hypothetical protein PFISCL1PPCAC_15366 [Pristionchus fissidentatus]
MKENKSPQSGRILFCRKCECHGHQVILKGHAPKCPYELCNCNACEKLMHKRMRSFEKRNGELIKSALQAKKNQSPTSTSPHSPISDYDQEMQSNGKPMTVMSYQIWKAKCAQEKKEREAAKKENPLSQSNERKRTYPFGDDRSERSTPPSNVRGTYVNLPTIPPVRVLVDADNKTIIAPEMESRGVSPAMISVDSQPHSSTSTPLTTSPSPSSRPRLSSLPLTSPSPSFIPRLSSLPLTSPSPLFPSDFNRSFHSSASIPSSTTVVSSLPSTVPSSLPSTVPSSLPSTVSSSSSTSSSSLTPSDISSLFQTMPTSLLLRNCALNHERLQQGLPIMNLPQPTPLPLTVPQSLPLPSLPSLGVPSVESSLLSQLATILGSQSVPQSIPSIPSPLPSQSLLPIQIPSSLSSFIPNPTPLPLPPIKLDPTSLSPDVLQLLNQNLVQFLTQ